MKKFIKRFTNLVHFKTLITTIIFIVFFSFTQSFGATARGSARVVILEPRDNMKTYITEIQTAELQNTTQIQNIKVINY